MGLMMDDKENLTADVNCNTKHGDDNVNNALVWILAFIPVVGAFFEFGPLLFLAVNIVLCIFDKKNLRKAGYNTKSLGSAWLIPFYLYKRAKYFNHKALQSGRHFLIRIVHNRMTVENGQILDTIRETHCKCRVKALISRDSRRNVKEREVTNLYKSINS
jgi:hypothetical protein